MINKIKNDKLWITEVGKMTNKLEIPDYSLEELLKEKPYVDENKCYWEDIEPVGSEIIE